eukprot:gene23781-biopygen8892
MRYHIFLVRRGSDGIQRSSRFPMICRCFQLKDIESHRPVPWKCNGTVVAVQTDENRWFPMPISRVSYHYSRLAGTPVAKDELTVVRRPVGRDPARVRAGEEEEGGGSAGRGCAHGEPPQIGTAVSPGKCASSIQPCVR